MGKHTSADPSRALNVFQLALLTFLSLSLLATLAGAAWLWPHKGAQDLVTPEFAQTFGLNHEKVDGEVTALGPGPCTLPLEGKAVEQPPALAGEASCTVATVRLDSGTDAGKFVQLINHGVAGEPHLSLADAIRLSYSPPPAGTPMSGATYAFADFQRGGALQLWAVVAAVLLLGFAAWHGLRSLVGLGASLAVILFFLLPGLIEGRPALPLALVTCCAIVFLAVPLVHGVKWKSAAALGGAIGALLVSAGLAAAAISSTNIQGMSNEENLKLALYMPHASIIGVLLCGFIVGAIGGLNDVAIAQASTVTELYELEPDSRPWPIFLSAMRVGRDHIASMVYTLVLTYTGTALPLLMLLSAGNQPWSHLLSSDIIATELLRSGVGAVGLTLTVPLTTLIAAWVSAPRASAPSSN